MSIKVAPEVRSNVYTGTNGDMSVALVEYNSNEFRQGDVVVLVNLPIGAELLEFTISSELIPIGVSAHLGVMYQNGTIEFIHPAITIAESVNEKVTLIEPFKLTKPAQLIAKIESSGTTIQPQPQPVIKPTPPAKQYDFYVTLGGSSTTPKVGLDHTGTRTQGNIRPDSWAGGSEVFSLLSVNRINGAFIIKANDASKWNDSDVIQLEVEGYANNPIVLSWFDNQSWYSKLNEGELYDYFLERLATNEVIGANIKVPVLG